MEQMMGNITEIFKVLSVPTHTDGRFEVEFKNGEKKGYWLRPDYTIANADGICDAVDQVIRVGKKYRGQISSDHISDTTIMYLQEVVSESKWQVGDKCYIANPRHNYTLIGKNTSGKCWVCESNDTDVYKAFYEKDLKPIPSAEDEMVEVMEAADEHAMCVRDVAKALIKAGYKK